LKGGNAALEINGQFLQVGGDVIVAADGQPMNQMEELLAFLQGREPDEEVTFTLLRDGELVEVDVTLGERPSTTP
jgi:S1-C subfamily serine protease